MKRALVGLLGALAIFVASSSAQAAVLQIQFSGLDLAYNGTDICDAATCSGGSGNFADSDPLTTVTFLVNGVLQGAALVSNIAADINIGDVFNIPVGGGTVFSGDSGIFDILTKATGWGLALNINPGVQITYVGGLLTVLGAGTTNNIFAQDLPFGLEIGTPVNFSFSSQILDGSMTDDGTYLTSFTSSGTGEINGPSVVPEPATMVLFGLGLLGTGIVARRRRQ